MFFALSALAVSRSHRPEVRNQFLKYGYAQTWTDNIASLILGSQTETESSSYDDEKLANLVKDVAADSKVSEARISEYFGRIGAKEKSSKCFNSFEVSPDPANNLQYKPAVIISQVTVTKNGNQWHVDVSVRYYICTIRATQATYHYHGRPNEVFFEPTNIVRRALTTEEIERCKAYIYSNLKVE